MHNLAIMAKRGLKVYFCCIVCCLGIIKVNGAKTIDTLNVSTCKNEKVDLRPGAGIKYAWQDGSSNNHLTIIADVNKTINVTVYTVKDTATIIYNITPINCIIDAGPDVAICKGTSTTLKATTNGTFKEWKPITALSSPTTITTTATPTITTKYVVTAIFPKQNLITNGDFEKGFENFSSDYVYGVNTLKYGYYVIGTNPYSYGPSWARNFTDHTTGSGKMMIIDGSEVLNQDVYRTTVSVLAGENYVFSTWLKNVKSDLTNPAKLRFYVNGQAMGSLNLPAGETEWVYYSTFWTATTDTTITISIKNQNTSGIGNDFAIDDMTFADFITISDTVEVKVNNLPIVTATSNKPKICIGESVTLNGGNALTYVWNNNISDNESFSPTTTKIYTVTGIDGNGCKNTAGVTVTVNPLPTITALAKPSVICVGASSTLTANGGISYIWSNGQTNGTAISPLSTDNYTVTGIDVNGCINKTSLSIIVNPLPTVSSLSTVVCTGQTTKLSGIGASTYIWDNSISNNVSFIPTATKTYTVTGTDMKSCKGTASAIVTVNPLPNVSAIAGPAILCLGKTTKLSGQGAQSYYWDNSVSDNVSFTPLATKTYKVTGIDNNECINTASIIVTVNALPTITVASSTICIGQSTTLNANGATSFIWDGGISNNVSFSPLVTAQYTVTGVDLNGCENTSTAKVIVNSVPTVSAISATICFGKSTKLNGIGANTYVWDGGISDNVLFSPSLSKTYNVTGIDTKGCKGTASASITVNSLPNVSAIANPAVLCMGKSTKLSGQGAQTYSWDNTITDTVSFSPISTKTYKVTGTDNNGCINTSSVIVTVNAIPTIIVTSPTICIGQSTKLSANGASSYIWDGGITDNIPFSPIETTKYSVTGTNANLCINTSIAIVTVNNLPNITAIPQTICFGFSTKLQAKGAQTYLWDGDIINNGAFIPNQSKIYTVTGTDYNGCKNTASTTVTVNQLPTVTASSQTICIGQQYAKLQGNGAITYLWDSGIYDNMQFAPQQTQSYTVTGTDVNGCKNTATAVVTVNPVPTVTASSKQICPNEKVRLQGEGAISYVWDGGIEDSIEFTAPKSTSTYHVTGTDANACYGVGSATIFLHSLPNLQFEPIPSICVYADSISIDKASPSGGKYSGNGIEDTFFSPVSAGEGNHTITYSYTDNNGCKNTVSQTVQVNPKPLLAFNLDAQRCYDAGPLQLSASPVGGTFYGEGVNGSLFYPMIADSLKSIPISYTYTDPTTGCADTNSKNIIVQYTPPPVVYDVQTTTYDLQTSIFAEGDGEMQWYDTGALNNKKYIGNPFFHGYTTEITRFYYITQIINGCESVADTMRLKITSCKIPPPIVSKPTKKCMYDILDSAEVSNTLIDGKIAKVIWRDKNYNVVSNSSTFSPFFEGPGLVTYMVSLELYGCEGAGVNVTWSRYQTPSPVITPLKSICEGKAVSNFQMTNIYGDVKWYNNASLDTLLAISTSFKPLSTKPGTQFYWVTNNDMCISEPVVVKFVIHPKPPAPIGELLYESCQESPILSMSVVPAYGTTWYDSKNNNIASDISAYKPPLSSLKLDEKVGYSTIYFDGFCYSDPFLFNYLLKQKPPKPKLHPDTICLGSTDLSISVLKGNNITWYFPDLDKQYYTGLTVSPEVSTIGTFAFHVWDELNGCKGDYSTDTLYTGATPKNGILGPDQICVNSTKQRYNVTSKNPESEYTWSVTGGRMNYKLTNSVQYYSDFDFIEQGIDTIYVTEKTKFGCKATDSAVIRVASKPSPDYMYTVPYENYKYYFTNVTDSLYITDGLYKELVPQSFKWNFGRETDTIVPQTYEEYLEEKPYNINYPFGTYDIYLIATPIGYDCPDTITKQIFVDIKEALYVPNAFCPDHKSPNLSRFTAKGFNLKYYKMWIYDIWGNLIWYTDKLFNGQPAEGWDGTYDGVIQKVDSYVWKMEVEFLDGKLWNGQKGAKTVGNTSFGNVLLLR